MPDTTPLRLLFGVHAHQPVGNFPSVIDEAVERCYRPFLETMARYPAFGFALHLSGWLLGDLSERHPDVVETIAGMVASGQLELFGAGDCEPVLAAIPERDRASQLEAMNLRLERSFGLRPTGAWLTERVWESGVVPALAGAGMRYVVVDDYHFLCAGEPPGRLDRHFATEEGGVRLDVYPISEALRYRLPFSPAPDALAWLEAQALHGLRAAVHFDDLEKFGIWPETHDWVYRRGWLQRFVESVLESSSVRAERFDRFHASHAPRGPVYLPSTSYIEMNAWTLPPDSAHRFEALQARERAAGSFETSKAFLRGGIWRNFLSRYPEANWLHKRMLQASARLHVLGEAARPWRPLLHQAQSNDAYWHGLFGGLYLPHLRRAAWRNLCALDTALDALAPRPSMQCLDLDLDGRREWLFGADGVWLAARDDGLAAVHEFCVAALAHNFADTLARREEAYHARVGMTVDGKPGGEGIASAHDRIAHKQPIAPEDLAVDPWPRAVAVDCLLTPDGEHRCLDAYRAQAVDVSAAVLDFETLLGSARVRKRIAVADGCVRIEWHCQGLAGHRLRTQLNLAMPSCDGFAGRYVLADGSMPAGFGQTLALDGMRALALDDRTLDGTLHLRCTPSARLSAQPVHTVSLSEGGFEKIMQAAVLELEFVLGDDEQLLLIELRPESTGPSATAHP